MQVSIKKHEFIFNTPGGTSRGVLHTKPSYFIRLEHEEKIGIGEVSLIPNLSIDTDVETKLNYWQEHFRGVEDLQKMQADPAIKFGFETALKSLASIDPYQLFDTPFSQGKEGIYINGLVWMGDIDFMMKQLKEKLELGFKCLKFKVGAIDFDEELKLLETVRGSYDSDTVEIRLDANGAFTPENALDKLTAFSKYDIHSIEQPIKPGQFEAMASLAKKSPIPIVLDEELIGVPPQDRRELLSVIKPQYIILKPSLIGGFEDSTDWITIAEELGIQWWITSALEGNIGLNAIAQFCSQFNLKLPQGLGTGQVFSNNIQSPLTLQSDKLFFGSQPWGEIKW